MPSAARSSVLPTLSDLTQNIESWSIPVRDIWNNDGLRFDATHYDREAALTVQKLANSGYKLKSLSDLAEIKLPGQFTRIWAKGPEHGYRYINGTELINIAGLGAMEKAPRYLSKLTKTKIDNLIIREGWLLVTCSGTIGRIIYVSKRFDGWAATHDLIRVIPHSPNHLGYLYTYLSSPMAQAQILGHTHGGQIDHVTHHQLKTILVPVLPEKEMTRIHKSTMAFLANRDEAVVGLVNEVSGFTKRFE
jgi:type I restriction enzyme S subunit